MTSIPLTRILTKAMLRPWETPEAWVAYLLLKASKVGVEYSNYRKLRTGGATWLDEGCGNLPQGLEVPPVYWLVPWARKVRKPMTATQIFMRHLRFPALLRRFEAMVGDTARAKTWVGPPAKGILLHGNGKDAFILTDGNHRLGALAALFTGRSQNVNIPVDVNSEWDLDRTMHEGYLSEQDNRTWWNHCWRRLDD